DLGPSATTRRNRSKTRFWLERVIDVRHCQRSFDLRQGDDLSEILVFLRCPRRVGLPTINLYRHAYRIDRKYDSDARVRLIVVELVSMFDGVGDVRENFSGNRWFCSMRDA